LNPEIAGTAGKLNIEAQLFDGAVMTGPEGKTAALIVVSWHAGIALVALAGVVPHADVSLYLAFMIQHPGVFVSKVFVADNVPYALNDPPGGCTAYSAVNPKAFRLITAWIPAKGELQVLAMAVIAGAAGKITTSAELLKPHKPDPAVPAAVEPHAEINT